MLAQATRHLRLLDRSKLKRDPQKLVQRTPELTRLAVSIRSVGDVRRRGEGADRRRADSLFQAVGRCGLTSFGNVARRRSGMLGVT